MSNLLKATTLESATSPTVRSGSSLMFIDAGLAQGDLLARSAAASTEVYYLRQDQDAIAQISQVLQGRSGIESLHILSHGSSGGLNFAGSELTLATLPSKVMELRSWQSALSENADILLYGCDVASNAAGSAFINMLGQATGADIAASTDLTGFGGNWILEASTGSIEAQVIAPNDYQGTLAPPVITGIPTNITYTENATSNVFLFTSSSAITDSDNPTTLTGGGIRVAVQAGKSVSDVLSIASGVNSITLNGTAISMNSQVIGSFSGGFNGDDLVVRFTGTTVTLAMASAILRSITYANLSEGVVTQANAKTLAVTVTDNANEVSAVANINVNLTGAADPFWARKTTLLYSANGTSKPESATGAVNGPWLNFQESGGTSTVTSTATETTLNSGGIGTFAGYTNYATINKTVGTLTIPTLGTRLKSTDYLLNSTTGYSVNFSAQVMAESHPGQESVTGQTTTTTDRNGDGKGDRAGFSILIVSNDATRAIELGFWNDRIFAQNDALNQTNKAIYGTVSSTADDNLTLFTSAETVMFDTTQTNINYEVVVLGNSYTLLANGEAILRGRLRNYSTVTPVLPAGVTSQMLSLAGITTDSLNPYNKANLIFLGDNTSDANSAVKISQISVGTLTTLTTPALSGITGLPIALTPFTLTSVETSTPTITLESSKGTINLQPGILPANVTLTRSTDTAGKKSLKIEGATIAQINQLLSTSGGITYTADSGYVGSDSINLIATSPSSTTSQAIASITNTARVNTREIIWRNETTGDIGMQYYSPTLGYLTAKSIYYLTEDANGLVGNVKGDWQIKVLADFNGDGTTDALWQNSITGDIGVWEMKGNLITGWKQFSYQENGQTISLGSLPTNWQVLNLGKTRPVGSSSTVDALFLQNTTTGEVGVWQLNGFNVVIAGSGVVTDTNSPATKPGSEWRVTNWDDFDGDGATDALFQNTRTGELAIWELNGKQAKSLYSIGTPAASANVSLFTTGQYTFGDSKADLVWVDKTTQKLTIDPITNKAINPAGVQLGAANNSTLGNPIYAADFNGDNKRELFWYNSSTGKFSLSTFEILSASNTVTSIADNVLNAPVIPANWYITAVGDFTGSAATVF